MREERFEEWKEKYADVIWKKRLEELEQTFQKNLIVWKEKNVLEFQKIAKEITKKQPSEKIGYFTYTLLRTRLLLHDYRYQIYLYGKEWYLKEGIEAGEWDVSYIYEVFEALWEDLLMAARQSRLLIGPGEVEHLLLEYVPSFHKYVVEVLRCGILEITELEEYERLEKEELFEIQAGEYFEPCEIIHKEGQEKKIRQIKKWLGEKKRREYCFEDFKNLNFQGEDMRNNDFQYTDFRGSNLDDADFSISLLIGSKWRGCSMRGTNLMTSMIANADFEGADLREANLQYCVAFTGKNEGTNWRGTGFTKASFRGSNLTEANFTGATLSGVDFVGAKLERSNFTGASLYGSKMTKEQIEESRLTKEQVEQIIQM